MKSIVYLALLAFIVSFGGTACQKGPSCPAYNSVHNSKDYGYNPNNSARAANNNKKDIEKRKEAELNPKKTKRRKAYSLFPKGVR